MRAGSAFRVGQFLGSVFAIGIVIAYFAWGYILRITADVEHDHVLFWFHDQDAAPGDHVDMHVWMDRSNGILSSVHVYFIDDEIGVARTEEGPDETSLDVSFTIPEDSVGGGTLESVVKVYTSNGETAFEHDTPIVGRRASMLRRIGKAAAALGCLVVIGGLLFERKRAAMRRGKEPSALWMFPMLAFACVTVVPAVEQATRVHAWWFRGLLLATSAAVGAAIAEWFNRRLGLVTYAAEQVLIETGPDVAYRGAAVVLPIRPVDDLEAAWSAAGLVARRSRRDLIVTRGGMFAVIPVPGSMSFGAAPLVFRASDPAIAKAVIEAAATVLGELRLHGSAVL
jgi:hypothetical protein